MGEDDMADSAGIRRSDGKRDWRMGLAPSNDGGLCANICTLNDGVIHDESSKSMRR